MISLGYYLALVTYIITFTDNVRGLIVTFRHGDVAAEWAAAKDAFCVSTNTCNVNGVDAENMFDSRDPTAQV